MKACNLSQSVYPHCMDVCEHKLNSENTHGHMLTGANIYAWH